MNIGGSIGRNFGKAQTGQQWSRRGLKSIKEQTLLDLWDSGAWGWGFRYAKETTG